MYRPFRILFLSVLLTIIVSAQKKHHEDDYDDSSTYSNSGKSASEPHYSSGMKSGSSDIGSDAGATSGINPGQVLTMLVLDPTAEGLLKNVMEANDDTRPYSSGGITGTISGIPFRSVTGQVVRVPVYNRLNTANSNRVTSNFASTFASSNSGTANTGTRNTGTVNRVTYNNPVPSSQTRGNVNTYSTSNKYISSQPTTFSSGGLLNTYTGNNKNTASSSTNSQKYGTTFGSSNGATFSSGSYRPSSVNTVKTNSGTGYYGTFSNTNNGRQPSNTITGTRPLTFSQNTNTGSYGNSKPSTFSQNIGYTNTGTYSNPYVKPSTFASDVNTGLPVQAFPGSVPVYDETPDNGNTGGITGDFEDIGGGITGDFEPIDLPIFQPSLPTMVQTPAIILDPPRQNHGSKKG